MTSNYRLKAPSCPACCPSSCHRLIHAGCLASSGVNLINVSYSWPRHTVLDPSRRSHCEPFGTAGNRPHRFETHPEAEVVVSTCAVTREKT